MLYYSHNSTTYKKCPDSPYHSIFSKYSYNTLGLMWWGSEETLELLKDHSIKFSVVDYSEFSPLLGKIIAFESDEDVMMFKLSATEFLIDPEKYFSTPRNCIRIVTRESFYETK